MIKLIKGLFFNAVLSQVIQMLSAIAIARLFSPDSYGYFAEWLGVLNLSSVLCTLRLDAALVNAKTNVDRTVDLKNVIYLVFLLSLTLSCLAVLIKYIFLIEQSYLFIITLGIASLFSALNNSLQNYFSLNGEYSNLKRIRMQSAFWVLIFQLLAGFLTTDSEGLFIGYTLGVACALIVPLYQLDFFRERFSVQSLIDQIRKSKRYIYFSLPGDLINVFINQIPIFFIAAKFGPAHAGFFSLATKTIGIPVSLISVSFQDVFKRYAAQSYHEYGSCRGVYLKFIFFLVPISILILSPVFFFSDLMFVTVFGKDWLTSANIAVLLLPMFFARLIIGSVSYITYIVGIQHIDFLWQLALACIMVILFNYSDDFYGAIKLFALQYTAFYVLHGFLTFSYSKNSSIDRGNILNLWMTCSEQKRFKELLGKANSYIEFGMGGSTLEAINYGIKKVVSVETSTAWIKKLKKELGPQKSGVEMVHFGIGPTYSVGYPLAPKFLMKQVIDRNFATLRNLLNGKKFDLCLVDGRYRVASAAFLCIYLDAEAKILVHDYSVRPEYWVLETFMNLVKKTDTLAEFTFDATDENRIKSEMVFKSYKLDPR